MSKLRRLPLIDPSPSPIWFSDYEEFLALTEEETLRVVNAVARADIGGLLRLFGASFPKLENAQKGAAQLVATNLLAVGAGVARVTPSGRMEFDIHMNELETFSNVLVRNKVDDALPIINKVLSNLMVEFKSVVPGGG